MRNSNWKFIIKEYLKNNYREYLLICILFLIGIFTGVMIINFSNENKISEIDGTINEFINKYKIIENINNLQLTIQSIKINMLLAIILWIAGTTVIGLPIVLLVILIRGIILGFTISSITVTLGKLKGILFCMSSVVLQNVLYIPAIFTIGVSSIKLYNAIMKDKRKENIKIEIYRHTFFSLLMLIGLLISSVLETYISGNLFTYIINYL